MPSIQPAYKMMTPCLQKSCPKYTCKLCDYNTSKHSSYKKHLLTAKHEKATNDDKMATNDDKKLPKSCPHVCTKCNQQFSHRQTLWRHIRNKSCKIQNIENTLEDIDDATSNITDNITWLIQQQMTANNEFKEMMIEQTAQMLEIAKNSQIINNNTTNNNNQRFNLNFFLNDTCKDAMSITDFLRNMNVHVDELEYIGNHGYVNGMTKMIMDRLKDMDITKRPIHCTDIKRETMYIKDEDGWAKDTDELSKLRKILSRISMNNYRTVPDWRTAHPDCQVMETRNYEFCYKMMRAILGDVEDEQTKMDNKIIKTMAKELFVEK